MVDKSAPAENRTQNLRIRSPLLYPIELRARGCNYRHFSSLFQLERGLIYRNRSGGHSQVG